MLANQRLSIHIRGDELRVGVGLNGVETEEVVVGPLQMGDIIFGRGLKRER